MLMNVVRPVQPGDQVTVTLTFSDGTTSAFAAIAKPFTGADAARRSRASLGEPAHDVAGV